MCVYIEVSVFIDTKGSVAPCVDLDLAVCMCCFYKSRQGVVNMCVCVCNVDMCVLFSKCRGSKQRCGALLKTGPRD